MAWGAVCLELFLLGALKNPRRLQGEAGGKTWLKDSPANTEQGALDFLGLDYKQPETFSRLLWTITL